MIYRIADEEDWRLARQTGQFVSADLAAEGFIHASELQQVLRTAEKYCSGKTGLALLEIDDSILGEKVVREDLAGSGLRFPHIYAPVPLHAIVRHFDFPENAGGGFSLPPALAE